MSPTIALMSPQHIPELLDLWQATPNIGLSSADTPERLTEFITRNPSTCFVAIQDGRVIGSAMGGYDGRRGYLYHLAVRKEFQGQGLGQALLARVMAAFDELGVQKVHLFVFHENERAISFYQKAGWEVRRDIIVMSRRV